MAVGERYVARVSGYLSAAARDTPRQLVSQFDAFVGVLRSDFASVSILQAPIELGRSQTPSKVDGDRPELQHKPFVLTLSDQVSP